MTGDAPVGQARRRGLGLEILLCGLVAGLSGLVYAGFYSGWRFAPAVLGAAAVPAVLALAVDRWGWSAARFGLLAAVGLPLYAVLVVYWGDTSGGLPGPAAWSALGHGVVNGWAEMLSVGLPADARGDLLLTPVVLTWAASALGAALAMRTASPLLPLAPVTVTFTVGLALVAAGGRAHLGGHGGAADRRAAAGVRARRPAGGCGSGAGAALRRRPAPRAATRPEGSARPRWPVTSTRPRPHPPRRGARSVPASSPSACR